MGLSEGLYPYEIVLLFLGAVMFLILLIFLIYFVLKRRSIKTLLAFFSIPIIMIGYPSIQSIKFGDLIEIAKESAKQVAEKPGDKQAEENLRASLSKIEARPIRNPAILLTLAKAHGVLGDTLESLKYADSVLAINTASPDAVNSQVRTEAVRIKTDVSIANFREDAGDSAKHSMLVAYLRDLEKADSLDPAGFMTIARGYAALGDSSRSIFYADSALRIEPDLGEAIVLRRQMGAGNE